MKKTAPNRSFCRRLAIASVPLAALVASCSSGSGATTDTKLPATISSDTTTDEEPSDPSSESDASLDGVWEFTGAGYVAEVSDSEITRVYMPVGSWCTSLTEGEADGIVVSGDENGVTAAFPGSISRWQLEKTELPKACETPDGAASPQETVEAFIEVMDERYPFFVERDLDWETKKSELKTAAQNFTTTDQATALLAAFTNELGDGHTGFDGPPSPEEEEEFEQFEKLALAEFDKVATLLGPSIEGTADDPVFWGSIDSTIGYLAINQMQGYSQSEQVDEEVEAFAELLDQALEDLNDHDQLIIDVRGNGGGHDAVSIEAVRRFINRPSDLFTKEQYSAPETKFVVSTEPTERVRYEGKVTLLVSTGTASAAEIFGASMHQATEATIVGSPTQGIFSDINPWTLPGDVDFGYSAEVYRDLEGETYEVRGVPIDIEAPIEESLEAALEAIRQGK